MSVVITITVSDADAARIEALIPSNITPKQYLINWITQQVMNHEQAVAAQTAQASVTPISPS